MYNKKSEFASFCAKKLKIACKNSIFCTKACYSQDSANVFSRWGGANRVGVLEDTKSDFDTEQPRMRVRQISL